jgi:hypothetical protein
MSNVLDRVAILEESAARWEDRYLDDPHHINGFTGEFNITDHALAHEVVQNLVMYSVKHERFRDVPLSTVNSIAREVHGGKPGFVQRAYARMAEIQRARNEGVAAVSDKNVYEPTLTIDDWNSKGNEDDDGK